jgi:hypothetical protein
MRAGVFPFWGKITSLQLAFLFFLPSVFHHPVLVLMNWALVVIKSSNFVACILRKANQLSCRCKSANKHYFPLHDKTSSWFTSAFRQ